MHVFYAHGGGLGHLTRIDKLIKKLEIPVGDVLIITPSSFTKYFKSYAFVKISWNETAFHWSKTIERTIDRQDVTAFYIDTFPFGIKGELVSVYKRFPKLEYVYVSRLLKWQSYLDAIVETIPIEFSKTIRLEALYPEHDSWIEQHSKTMTTIKLKTMDLSPISFIESPYVLVVHSGGKADVLEIVNKAIKDYKHNLEVVIVVFTQVDININDARIIIHKDVYPVSMYFKHALRIYTAAGFNSMHELQSYETKHVAIPFDKLYDDQFFRYSNRSRS